MLLNLLVAFKAKNFRRLNDNQILNTVGRLIGTQDIFGQLFPSEEISVELVFLAALQRVITVTALSQCPRITLYTFVT
jgi:hypothetical protein